MPSRDIKAHPRDKYKSERAWKEVVEGVGKELGRWGDTPIGVEQ